MLTVEKSEAAYQKVCRLKTQLCRDRSIPWHYFADSSRVSYDNGGFEGIQRTSASNVDRAANLYRRDVWRNYRYLPSAMGRNPGACTPPWQGQHVWSWPSIALPFWWDEL